MYGAIIGDLAGSIYEYDQVKKVSPVYMNNIIEDNSFFSDDTILTVAVLDAILNGYDYDDYLRKYVNDYKDYLPNFKPYFKASFAPNMIKWSEGKTIGNSAGNGAMMRVSPVGYMFDSADEVIKHARLATIPSHNNEDAIKCATTIALIIYYLRCGLNRRVIMDLLDINLKYEPFNKFNTTSVDTIGNCLYAFFTSNSFEDAIRKALLMGGDTDTNACIVASMAEALYGIDKTLIDKSCEKIPSEFVKVLKKVR